MGHRLPAELIGHEVGPPKLEHLQPGNILIAVVQIAERFEGRVDLGEVAHGWDYHDDIDDRFRRETRYGSAPDMLDPVRDAKAS